MSKEAIHPVVRRFVEDAGSLSQSLGVGRVIGQLYAYLYFSSDPRNLGQMQAALGISKGSASTAVRQLEQWGAVKKVWIKGDRKDYYTANDWLGGIFKNAVVDTVGKKLTTFSSLLDDINQELDSAAGGDGEGQFIRDRIEKLRAFQEKAQGLWQNPLIKLFMK